MVGPPTSGNGFGQARSNGGQGTYGGGAAMPQSGPPSTAAFGGGGGQGLAPPMSAPGQVRGAVHIGGVGAKCGMGCFGGLYLVARSWERCVAGTVRRRLRCGDQG